MSLRIGWSSVLLLSCASLLGASDVVAGDKIEVGRELFEHEWRPNDPRSFSGDGLGPVFNDVSCVACHKQGAVGGGGPVEKNVQVGSIFAGALFNVDSPKVAAAGQRAELETIHPGFLKSRSVVLHRSSTDAAYGDFRAKNFTHKPHVTASAILALLSGKANPLLPAAAAPKVAGDTAKEASADPELTKEQLEEIARLRRFAPSRLARRDFREVSLLISERNTPALFGSGLIESIPDSVLKKTAALEHHAYPEITGRVARSASGRVGRYGWKGQQAKLHDFVLAACATEVGLQVPGKSQGVLPYKPDDKPPGFDLTANECLELTAFIAELPAPRQLSGGDRKSSLQILEGSNLFGAIGCAVCHSRDLGEVSGIYSDLLLHDMGRELSDPGDPGAYGGSEDNELNFPLPPLASDFGIDPGAAEGMIGNVVVGARVARIGNANGVAGPQEWRTPPLWGVRDSAPYLHDGRAETIEQAIALHDGESKRSMRRFFQLSADQRTQLMAFLDSLAAPE